MNQSEVEREMIHEEICKDHAALVVSLLEDQTGGDLEQCLSIARAEYDATGSDLWLAVCDNLRVMRCQSASRLGTKLHAYLTGSNEAPF